MRNPLHPDAPVISSTEPAFGGAAGSLHCVNACHAVRYTSGAPATSSSDQPLRNRNNLGGIDYRLFRQCPPGLHPGVAAQNADGIAQLHALDSRADGHYFADPIAPEYVRQFGLGRILRQREKSVRRIETPRKSS